jgi:AraC family transcriptional regulator
MDDQTVKIMTLPPMRMATFYAYSTTPEHDAWQKLYNWAKAQNLWEDPPAIRIFGFDNPSPSEGSPNRGYEFWLTIGPELQVGDEIRIKEFPGGTYGVMHCDVSSADPFDIIPATWQKLVKWLESSHYKYGNDPCLEEHLTRKETPDQGFLLDLYIPIRE